MLQFQHTAMLMSISRKLDIVLKNSGISDADIAKVNDADVIQIVSSVKSQIQRWKPFLQMLSDDDGLSSTTFDDLMKQL
jgi:ribosome-interacting GTPase 1